MPATADIALVGALPPIVLACHHLVGKRALLAATLRAMFLTREACLVHIFVGHELIVGRGCDSPIGRA